MRAHIEHVVVESECSLGVARPRLADDVELIGISRMRFQEPRYIVRRGDGQVVQLPRLLYLLAASVDRERDLAQVAGVSARLRQGGAGRAGDGLLDNRLRPAGSSARSEAADPALRRLIRPPRWR